MPAGLAVAPPVLIWNLCLRMSMPLPWALGSSPLPLCITQVLEKLPITELYLSDARLTGALDCDVIKPGRKVRMPT